MFNSLGKSGFELQETYGPITEIGLTAAGVVGILPPGLLVSGTVPQEAAEFEVVGGSGKGACASPAEGGAWLGTTPGAARPWKDGRLSTWEMCKRTGAGSGRRSPAANHATGTRSASC